MPGDTFNDLTYLHDTPRRFKTSREAMFLCMCGNTKVMSMSNVRSGRSKTCGCKQYDDKTFHGEASRAGYSILYSRWKNMKQRCNNKNAASYHNYGERGIKLCPEWDNFAVFSTWAKNNGFNESLEIDRKNNNLGYSPDNCRWVTRPVQQANCNKRKGMKYKYIGVYPASKNTWKAVVTVARKGVTVGSYTTEEEAVLGRNQYIITNALPHKIQEI